jgi:HEPN domain-containing protein
MDESDKEHVVSWSMIAKRDLDSARKLAAGIDPYLDTAIDHCQQAAENADKGFLALHTVGFPKTHDIRKVVALAEVIEPGFAPWLSAAELLTPYAIAFRNTDDVLEPSRE